MFSVIKGRVLALLFTLDKKCLLSGSSDKKIIIWNADNY